MSLTAVLNRYDAGGPILSYAVSGLGDDQKVIRPGPGAWSIAELVAHLVDADLVIADRMKRVIAENSPMLLAFDQDAWVARLDSASMPVGEGVDLFTVNRCWMSRILHRREADDFARVGIHTEAGRRTLAELIVGACHHLDHHLKFLYAKRANLGTAVYPRYSRSPEE